MHFLGSSLTVSLFSMCLLVSLLISSQVFENVSHFSFYPVAHYAARGGGVTCAALGKARMGTTGHFYSSTIV